MLIKQTHLSSFVSILYHFHSKKVKVPSDGSRPVRDCINTTLVCGGLPIDAGDVDDHVDHVTTQFVRLHVHWTAVCGNVNLTDHVEQEGLLNTRVLKTETETEKSITEGDLTRRRLKTTNILPSNLNENKGLQRDMCSLEQITPCQSQEAFSL